MLGQKVTKITKGRAGSKADEHQSGKSRGRSDYGWRLSPGERLRKTAEADGKRRRERWAASSGCGRKKTCGRWRNWESRSGENAGKRTNEPEREQMGAMRNMLFKFRLGLESTADRGLTRCLSKMQLRITDSSVVRGQLSVAGGGEETFGRADGGDPPGARDPRRTRSCWSSGRDGGG
jgi:hypothetical protein